MIVELLLFCSVSFQAVLDLRNRTAPVAFLLAGAGMAIGAPQDPFKAIMVMLALVWGSGRGPDLVAPLFLIHPSSFLLLPLAYRCRIAHLQHHDLLIAAGIAAVFPWPATLLMILGFYLWREWWQLRRLDPVMPAVPGMALGLATYLCVVI